MNENVEYALRIVLKARDDMSLVFKDARRELDAFEAKVEALDKKMAGINSKMSGLSRSSRNLATNLTNATTAADGLGTATDRLKAVTVDDTTAQEGNTEARKKGIDAIGKASIAEARHSSEVKRSTDVEKQSTAARKQRAKTTSEMTGEEKALHQAETKRQIDAAKAADQDAERNARLAKELRDYRKVVREAKKEASDATTAFEKANKELEEFTSKNPDAKADDGSWLAQQQEKVEMLGALVRKRDEEYKAAKAAREAKRAEVQANSEAIAGIEEETAAVSKATAAKKEHTKAKKASAAASKREAEEEAAADLQRRTSVQGSAERTRRDREQKKILDDARREAGVPEEVEAPVEKPKPKRKPKPKTVTPPVVEKTEDDKRLADMQDRFIRAVADKQRELGTQTKEGQQHARDFNEGKITMENIGIFTEAEIAWMHAEEEAYLAKKEATEAAKEETKAVKKRTKAKKSVSKAATKVGDDYKSASERIKAEFAAEEAARKKQGGKRLVMTREEQAEWDERKEERKELERTAKVSFSDPAEREAFILGLEDTDDDDYDAESFYQRDASMNEYGADDDPDRFGGGPIGGMGGGAPRSKAEEERLRKAAEANRKKQLDELAKLEDRFQRIRGALGKYFQEYKKGERDEDSWIFRMRKGEEALRKLANRLAEVAPELDHADRVMGAANELRRNIDEHEPVSKRAAAGDTIDLPPPGGSGPHGLPRKPRLGQYDTEADVQKKNTKAVKDHAAAALVLYERYEDLRKSIHDGSLDVDRALPGLREISKAIDKLAREAGPGTADQIDIFELGQDPAQFAAELQRQIDDRKRAIDEVEEYEQTRVRQTEEQRTAAAKKGADARAARQRIIDRQEADEHRRQVALGQADSLRDRYESILNAPDLSLRKQQVELERLVSAMRKVNSQFKIGEEGSTDFALVLSHASDRLRDVNRDMRAMSGNEDRVRGLSGVFQDLALRINRSGDNVATLDNKLRGMIVLAVMAFAQQLITVLLSLGGALTAVASSAIFAAGALGGALVAGIAQALPMVGLLVAALTQVKGVTDAVGQADLVQQQQFQRANDQRKKTADTADAVANAQDGVEAANKRVAEANDAVTEAQERLNAAREQAKIDLRDLIQAEREAELAAMGAAQSQEQAQRQLRLSIASGNVDDIEGNELGVLEADSGLDAARTRLADATRDRRKAQTSEPDNVKQAKKQLDDAKDSAKEAGKAVDKAQRSLDKAGRSMEDQLGQQFSGLEKLQYMLGNMSKGQLALFVAMQKIRATFTKTWVPILDIITQGFARGVNTLERLMRDDRVVGVFTQMAKGITKEMDKLREEFSSYDFINQFLRIQQDGIKNLPIIGDTIANLGHIFLDIAESAGPALTTVLEYIRDLSENIRDMTDDGGLDKFFDRGTVHFIAWMDLAGSLIKLLATIAGYGEESGLGMVEDLTKWLDRSTRWVNAHSKEVTQFFEDSRDVTYQLLRVLSAVAKAMFEVFDADRIGAFADFLINTLIPALVFSVKIIGSITDIIFKILDLPIISDITKWAITLILFGKVVTATVGLLGGFAGEMGHFFTLVEGLLGGVVTMGGKVVGVLSKIAAFIPGLGKLAGPLAAGAAALGVSGAARQGAAATALDAADAVDVVDGDGSRSQNRRRRGRGILGKLFGSGVADDVAEESADMGRRAGGRFSGAFSGLLKKAGWVGLGIAAVQGISTGLKYGDVGKGVRDFAHNLTFGLIDSSDEIAEKTVPKIVKALNKRLASSRPLKLPEFEQPGRNQTHIPVGAQVDPSKRMQKDPVTGESFDPSKTRAYGDKSQFDEWLDDIPKKLRKPVRQIIEMQDKLRQLRRNKDLGGLQGLADDAEKLGGKFPELGDAVDDFADRTEKAMDRVRLAFAPGKIARDFGRNLLGDPKHWRSIINDAMDEIEKLPPGARKNARKAIDGMVDGLEKNGHLSKKAAGRVRKRVNDEFDDMAVKTQKRTARMAVNVAKNLDQLGAVVGAQLGGFGGLVNDMLKGLGVAAADFIKKPGKTAHKAGEDAAVLGKYLSLATQGMGGAASGFPGYLGMPGERGKDEIPLLAGRGEVLLNHEDQRFFNAHLRGQETVQSLVRKKPRSLHAGTKEESPGYAKGGIVGIPWQPGEEINSSILPLLTRLRRMYDFIVTDAYDRDGSAGHKSPGHNVTGTAVDAVPGAGGSWDKIEALGRWAVKQGLTVGYGAGVPGSQAWSGHGRNEHIHIEFGSKSLAALAGVSARDVPTPQISGPKGALLDMGNAALKKVAKAARARIRRAEEEAYGAADGPYSFDSGVTPSKSVARTIIKVWRALGLPGKYLLSAFETGLVESGMQNLDHGDADSKGWRQERTSIYGPSATNVVASAERFFGEARQFDRGQSAGALAADVQRPRADLRGKYGQAREAAIRLLRSMGVRGFAQGGIPGYGGGDKHPILVEGGEHILSKEEVAAAGGHDVIRSLRAALGGGGQSSGGGYDTGGEIVDKDKKKLDTRFTTSAQRARLKRLEDGIYELPALPIAGWESLLREARRVFKAIGENGKKHATLVKNLSGLTTEGGVLDQMDAARERFTASLTHGMTNLTYSFDKIGGKIRNIKRTAGPLKTAERAVTNARKELDKTTEERSVVEEGLYKVDQRLARLRKGKITPKESERIGKLEAQRVNLRDRRDTLIATQDEDIGTLYEARVAKQAARIDKINTRASRRTGAADLLRRGASVLGRDDLIQTANTLQREALSDQANSLEKQIQKAKDMGNTELATDLAAQVKDLRMSVYEIATQQFRDAIDTVNKTATRRMGRLDLFGRMADALGQVGLDGGVKIGGETISRAGVFAARQQALETQRSGLQTILHNADPQNVGLIEDLTDQLAELDVTIAENTKAAFDAKVTAVNETANFSLNTIDLNRRITELRGSINGNTDKNELLRLANERGAVLQRQRLAQQALLDEAIAAGNQQGMNDLSTQLLENEVATLENTQSINELNGTIKEPQQFSTTAWTMFRQAIFDGMGGLLPEYHIPQMHTGGLVTKAGIFELTPGERVSADGSGNTNVDLDIHVTKPIEEADPLHIGKRVMREFQTANTHT